MTDYATLNDAQLAAADSAQVKQVTQSTRFQPVAETKFIFFQDDNGAVRCGVSIGTDRGTQFVEVPVAPNVTGQEAAGLRRVLRRLYLAAYDSIP